MAMVPADLQLEGLLGRNVGAAREYSVTLQLTPQHPLVLNMSTKSPLVGFYQVKSEKDCESSGS